MELELRLVLPNAWPPPARELDLLNSVLGSCRKRGFGEAFEFKATLPLFECEDGDGSGDGDSGGATNWEMCNKRKKLVGWPLVKCAYQRNSGGSGYVKVKMEGVAIGRKVDLSLHS